MASFRVANHFISLQNNGVSCPHQKVVNPGLVHYSREDNNPTHASLKKASKTVQHLSKLQKHINRPIQQIHEQLIGAPSTKALAKIPSSSHLNPIPQWVNYATVSDTTVPEIKSTVHGKPIIKFKNANYKSYDERFQTLEELPKETLIVVNAEGEKNVVLPFAGTKNTMKRYYGALPSPLQVSKLQVYVAFQDLEWGNPTVYWDGKLFPEAPVYPEHQACIHCATEESLRGFNLFQGGRGNDLEERLEGKRILNRVSRGNKVRKHASEYLARKRETVRMVRDIERVISLSGRNPWEESESDMSVLRPISAVPLKARVLFRKDLVVEDD